MTDERDWTGLGEALIYRRIWLDPRYANRRMFAKERGIDYRLVSDIERVRRTNFGLAATAEIELAYGLAPGSIGRFLVGGELIAAEDSLRLLRAAPNPRGDDDPGLKRIAQLWPSLSDHQRQLLVSMIEQMPPQRTSKEL